MPDSTKRACRACWLLLIPGAWALTGMLVIASEHRAMVREGWPVGICTYLAGAFFGPLMLFTLGED